jgi:hypothetical protein
VAEAVAAEVLVAELGDDFVAVGGVPYDGGGDAAGAGPGKQASVRLSGRGRDAALDHVADFGDEREPAGAFTLRALVGQTAG